MPPHSCALFYKLLKIFRCYDHVSYNLHCVMGQYVFLQYSCYILPKFNTVCNSLIFIKNAKNSIEKLSNNLLVSFETTGFTLFIFFKCIIKEKIYNFFTNSRGAVRIINIEVFYVCASKVYHFNHDCKG